MKLKNNYFILRHGQTIHQIKKNDIVYFVPEDRPPARLTEKGRKQVEKSAKILKNKKIDLIISSDVLRTRQTAKIVVKKINKAIKINYDKHLRDINWGIFQGKPRKQAWAYYKNKKEIFTKKLPKGENWQDCQKRMVDVLKDLEKKYSKKNILIISHGDPLLLLEGWVKGLNQTQLLKAKENMIQTGELRSF